MIRSEGNLTGKINSSGNLKGKLNVGIRQIYPELEDLSVTPSTSTQTFIHPNSYGYDEVVVNAIESETLNITPTEQSQAYTGLYDEVNVNPIPSEYIVPSGTLQITENGTASVKQYENANVNITPSLQSKTATPSTSQQVIQADNNYDGLSSVTINAVTNSIDNNIQSANIKKDIEILGVTGTFDGIDTSDADATAINIRSGKTAYVDGTKITGTLPVLTYPTNPSNPSDFNYQFIAASSARTVARTNIQYLMGEHQIATSSQPDSWMFEGNRKMKMGISYSQIINVGGITSDKIVAGNRIYGVSGTYDKNAEVNTTFDDTYSKITNNILSLPDNIDTSTVTNAAEMFRGLSRITEAPSVDLSNATNVSGLFRYCTALTTVPVYDWSSATNVTNAFGSCPNLSTQSLDNIMQTCISATSYTGTKTLAILGIAYNIYPASTIQALPHYQDFIDAGWTIGY